MQPEALLKSHNGGVLVVAGATVLFQMHDQDLMDLVSRMGSRVNNMTPVMRNFGQYMILRTEERFEDEETPEGVRWQPLSQVTLAMKAQNNDIDKILQAQGNLLLSITPRGLKDGVKISSNMVYAAIHQFGGNAGRAHKVKIPARPYLGFNSEDLDEFKRIVKDWIILGRTPIP